MFGGQTLAVGDTVLGDLGIALCGADGGAAVHLHLDVATGNLTLAHEAGSSAEDALAAASKVGAVVRLERLLCNLKHMNCSWVDAAFTLDTTPGSGGGGGGGGMEPRAALRWTEGSRAELPLMDSGHSRLSMRSRKLDPGAHDELKISIPRRVPSPPAQPSPNPLALPSRPAVVRATLAQPPAPVPATHLLSAVRLPVSATASCKYCVSHPLLCRPPSPTSATHLVFMSQPPTSLSQPPTSLGSNALVAPDTDVDCDDFTAWEAARAACLHLIGGTAPPDQREEWALLLTMPYLEVISEW